MVRKRIRIDIEDAEGTNFNLNLTGNITREKVLKAFEFKNKTNKNKTKKKKSKKQKSGKWFELDEVQIFNEMGLKGELEIYFKATEFLKEHLENLQKIKKTVDSIIDKGLKDDMGCIVYHEFNMPYQIAFQKSIVQRKKFSFKSTIEAIPTMIEVPTQ